MSVNGIDISRWQPTTPPLAGLGFAFARATYGTAVDPVFDHHAANIDRAGIVLGAYHFGRSGQYASVAGQIAAFLHVAAAADLLVLDLERDDLRRRNADGTITVIRRTPMSNAEATAFVRAVKSRTHKSVGLYHSDSGFPDVGQDFNWVARWGSEPTRLWTFWQYSGTALDRDRFNGTLADLYALAGTAVPAPPSTDTGGTTATSDGRRNVAVRYCTIRATTNRMELRKGQPIYESPGGRQVTAMARAATVPHVGLAGRVAGKAWRAVVVGTRWSYADGKIHPTELFVPAAAGKVVAA